MQRADRERDSERYITAERLAFLLARDHWFFESTGGGVTFSGGEALLHIDYVAEVAARLKSNGIRVAVETCGHFDADHFCSILEPLVDLLLFDLKIVDPQEHLRWTEADNRLILKNLATLVKRGVRLRLRVPLVPGITATPENLQEIARLAKALDVGTVELLPYNPSGFDKVQQVYGRTAVPVGPELARPMTQQEEVRCRRLFDGLDADRGRARVSS